MCIRAEALVARDTLVCNNATVHSRGAMMLDLLELLWLTGITLRFLPAYSPKLNPAELVFGYVKNWLRHNRDSQISLESDITSAFGRVTYNLMVKFYKKCCRNFT